MERSELIDLYKLLEKLDYYLKYDFSTSKSNIRQLLSLLYLESDDPIIEEELDKYILRLNKHSLKEELFSSQQIDHLEKNNNVETSKKITKEKLIQLLESAYQLFLHLDPYLEYNFFNAKNNIQQSLLMLLYEDQYVTREDMSVYININYLDEDNYET